MTTLIALSGKQFSGKDSLCQLLLDLLPDFRRVGLADALKAEYAAHKGLTVAEVEHRKATDPNTRGELIAWGQARRAEDPDYWVKQVLAQPGHKIVTDMRYRNEYERFRQEGAFLIRVEADRAVRAQRGTLAYEADPSETELDAITDWDWVAVNNSDLATLKAQLPQFLQRFSISVD
jgi:phosphomevalonate kinase